MSFLMYNALIFDFDFEFHLDFDFDFISALVFNCFAFSLAYRNFDFISYLTFKYE